MQTVLSTAQYATTLAAALALGLGAGIPPAPGTEQDAISIEVYGFNDFHGQLSATHDATLFAHTVEEQRAEFEAEHGEDTTLLTAAGDLIGASAAVSNVQRDEPALEVMNALELDVSAAGNHEFDQGLDDLRGRVRDLADFEFLTANLVDPETKEPVLPAYEVHDVGGVRVAVIGAVTNDLYATTTGAGLQGNAVIDLVESVNTVATDLEANDAADVIVAAYHEGSPTGGATPLEEATAASETFGRIVHGTDPAVDVIFTGHTHQAYLYDTVVTGTARPVLQTGQSGNLLGAVELTLDAGTHEVVSYEAELVERVTTVDDQGAFDPVAFEVLTAEFSDVTAEVHAVEQAAVAEFEQLQGTVVGTIDASITTDYRVRIAEDGTWRAGGTRRQETTLGNWAAEAVKDRVSLANQDVDLGVVNAGGLRAELLFDRFTGGGTFPAKEPALHGKVTLGEVLDVAPFGNTLVSFDLPGSSIEQVLEENWRDGTRAQHLGWSAGLTYTYDESRGQGDKVTGIWVDGEPLDPERMYTVATLSFLADDSWVGTGNEAPDGYEGFAVGRQDFTDLGITDHQAYREYIEAETAATGDIRPDFAKKSIEATGVPATVRAGTPLGVTLGELELDSDGAGDATTVTLAYRDAAGTLTALGEVPVPAQGESADLSGVVLPGEVTAGEGVLVATVQYDDRYSTTTEVHLALTVDAPPGS